MFPPLHPFFFQQLPTISFFSFSSSSPILSHSLTLPTKTSYLSHSLTIWPSSFSSISTSLSNSLIYFNGTQVIRPFHQCFPPYPLEWSGKANSGSSLDLQITTTPFRGCKGRISKFFKLFSFFNFSFDFLFQYIFKPINTWVLLSDGFRSKADTLGGVGTCLG